MNNEMTRLTIEAEQVRSWSDEVFVFIAPILTDGGDARGNYISQGGTSEIAAEIRHDADGKI